MIRHLARRLLSMVFVLLGMSILTFVISHIVPADPAAAAAGLNAGPEQIQALRHEMGLDLPLPLQYLHYMSRTLHADLGSSILNHRPVVEDLKTYLPASLELAVTSLVIYIPLGLILGILAASRAGGVWDVVTRLFSILGVSMPVFWVALLLQLFFYRDLRWLPSGGRIDVDVAAPLGSTGFYLIDSLLLLDGRAFISSLQHLALPALTLAIANIALVVRMTRSSVMEVLQADYIRTARAKGLAERLVLARHALKPALVPVITVIGLQVASLIAYVFLVEVVYSWPGIGTYAVRAIVGLDFEPIMGITLVFSVVYVLVNFAVDMLYMVLDPRIRY